MNAEVEVRVDHRIGDFFLQHIKDAQKQVWIMSPWLSPDFIDLILAKKAAGVDVRVLTSNDYVSGQKEALGKLIERQIRILKPENKILKYIGIAAIVIGFIIAIYGKSEYIFLSLVGVALYFGGRERTEAYWISKLGEGNLTVFEYHPYKLIHAKVYIADDWVMMGSANFTRNGLENSIEAMMNTKSEELAGSMTQTIGNLARTLNLKEISYNAVGRSVSLVEKRKPYYRRGYNNRRNF